MIKAYLSTIPSMYEGEDIGVRYCVFLNDEKIMKESLLLPYVKPVIVGQTAVLTLLQRLKKYKNEEIEIVINDDALYEIMNGSSTTTNRDVINLQYKTNRQINKFPEVLFHNVSKNKDTLTEWKIMTEIE